MEHPFDTLFEEAIQEHIKECLDVKFPTTDVEIIKKDVSYTARKFYELGLNAVKEKTNRVDGVVHHTLKSHWIVADKNKLSAILKGFPEGEEVELFICAKSGEKWK